MAKSSTKAVIRSAKTKEPLAAANTAKKKKAPTHPPTSQMVNAAILNLRERSGSSLYAIKRYIAAAYKIDARKLAPYICTYLKKAVAEGQLVQTKGKGAAGSFKLAKVVPAPKVVKLHKKPLGEKKLSGNIVAKKPSKIDKAVVVKVSKMPVAGGAYKSKMAKVLVKSPMARIRTTTRVIKTISKKPVVEDEKTATVTKKNARKN